MRLYQLVVTLEEYGPNKGKYCGSAQFKGEYGGVSVVLSPAVSDAVLKLCADAMVANAKDMANIMASNIIEQSAGAPRLSSDDS